MSRRVVVVAGALLMVCACAALAGGAWHSYTGPWFKVSVPPGFRTEARELRMAGDRKEFDGVSCYSPDGAVEFYVYSPQWSGTPKWISKRAGEKQISVSTEGAGAKKITYLTLKGPKGYRSYADTRNSQLNTRVVFGFAYRNQAAYKKYRPMYMKFKQSLVQFAD